MSRYIDADKLMLVLNDWQFLNAPFREEESGIVYDTIGGAMEYVKEQPTAEVAEIKRGRWIIDRKFGNDVMSDEQMVICSECGKGIFWGKQNYCPNCGAKMDEVDKNGDEITE